MNDSLTMIVPVRNQEETLAEQIEHFLDVLPDLTSRFEIIVVDDGSTDHSVEVVRELACEYPQVRLIRHAEPRGVEAASQTGLHWAQGQVVLIHDGDAPVSPTDLRRLWSLRCERGSSSATDGAPGVFAPAVLEQLTTWGQTLRNVAHGPPDGAVRLIRGAMPHKPDGRTDRAHRPRRPAWNFVAHLRQLALGE
ncbi:MAG TPA: glycosyltransferase family 2 protein [Pirellulales bacterium]